MIRTDSISGLPQKGVYRLVLYGARHGNDLETVAILDSEDNTTPIIPYSSVFNYRIEKGLPVETAFRKAGEFVSWNSSFYRTVILRILDETGKTLGYEVRPLYYPFSYGMDDLLDINYWRKDNNIYVYIRLKQSIQHIIDQDDLESSGRH